jgi:dolichol-phosphate mannosyltransferase
MIYFLIPTFNEETNIEKLYLTLSKVLTDYPKFYVLSDDGSKDLTIKTIKEFFKNEQFIILGDGNNRGPGAAFNIGFEWILNHSTNINDRIITLEADNTSDTNMLSKMLKISELGFDLVLASVYAQGGGFSKTSFFRKFVSTVANILMRFFFDLKILTTSSFYRIYKVETVKQIKKQYEKIIVEPGFISALEILIKAIRINASIIEVPIVLYSEERKGKSKMKIIKTSLNYFKFIIKNKTILIKGKTIKIYF